MNHELRVRIGLAAALVGLLLPVLSGRAFGGAAGSLFCGPTGCPSGLQISVYALSIPATLGVTLWWWTHPDPDRPGAAVGAEVVALFALVAWWFVVPAVGVGFLLVFVGGAVTATGTRGFFEGTDRDGTPTTTRLAGADGILVWAGFAAVAALGYWPLVLPVVYLPLLIVYLALCASPVTWRRAHLLVSIGAVVLGSRLWRLVDPTAERFAGGAVSLDAPMTVATSTLDRGVDSVPEIVVLVFSVLGGVSILLAALSEIAFQTSPSLTERVRPRVAEA